MPSATAIQSLMAQPQLFQGEKLFMPYERGKLSVSRGRLQVYYLNHGIVTTGRTSQLPSGPQPGPNVAPAKQGYRRARMITPAQTEMMVRMTRELNEGELDFDQANPYGASDLISGPEFVFHGSKMTWDAIHESGGLHSAGVTTDISAHVHSSQTARSGYVSGTRALSVAQSFASGGLDVSGGEYGFVYLFHVEGGVAIGPGHIHRQAEVAGLGQVPICDIMMFKWLAQPRKIYLNLDYTATPLTGGTINSCLVMIGGGATP